MSKKKKGKCIFSGDWLVDDRFTEWIEKSNSKWKARCKFCSKDFDISSMGVSALTSHIGGKKHSEIASLRKSQSGAMFFSKKAKHDTENGAKVTGRSSSIITALDSKVIRVMFLDSKIASSFQLSKTKLWYFITYGLATDLLHISNNFC